MMADYDEKKQLRGSEVGPLPASQGAQATMDSSIGSCYVRRKRKWETVPDPSNLVAEVAQYKEALREQLLSAFELPEPKTETRDGQPVFYADSILAHNRNLSLQAMLLHPYRLFEGVRILQGIDSGHMPYVHELIMAGMTKLLFDSEVIMPATHIGGFAKDMLGLVVSGSFPDIAIAMTPEAKFVEFKFVNSAKLIKTINMSSGVADYMFIITDNSDVPNFAKDVAYRLGRANHKRYEKLYVGNLERRVIYAVEKNLEDPSGPPVILLLHPSGERGTADTSRATQLEIYWNMLASVNDKNERISFAKYLSCDVPAQRENDLLELLAPGVVRQEGMQPTASAAATSPAIRQMGLACPEESAEDSADA